MYCEDYIVTFIDFRPIMPNDRCKQLFTNVNEGMICIDTDANTEAGENIGVCSGDSGGPLNLQEGPGQYMTVCNVAQSPEFKFRFVFFPLQMLPFSALSELLT